MDVYQVRKEDEAMIARPGQMWQSLNTGRCFGVIQLRDGRLALKKRNWPIIRNPNWSKYRRVYRRGEEDDTQAS